MASEEAAGANQPDSGPEGAVSRVIGALISPRATFESIAKRPTWIFPLVITMVVGFLFVFSFSQRIGWRTVLQTQLETTSAFNSLSPQQQQQRLDLAVRFAPIAAYASTTVGSVIILLIIAALYLGVFNIVFGTGIKYKQALGVSAHAYLPLAVKSLVGVLIVWVRPLEGVSLQKLVMSNVGAFLPSSSPAWLVTFGSLLDIFVFWTLALLSIGFAAASGKKLKVGTTLAVICVVWFIFVIGLVGLTALRG
jgi:hypothetical protein